MVILTVLNTTAHESQLLLDCWRFQNREATNAFPLSSAETGWQLITLPHCWGWGQAQVTKNYYRGPGWYRRVLDVKPEEGKRYFLRFEAAATAADVFLNGQKIGQHRGGFGAFGFEITEALNANGQNVIAVRVSNAPEPDIAPLSGDFCVFGGLYRPVHLLVADTVCFTPLDHASPGVAWLQTKVSAKEAIIDVTAHVSNGSKSAADRTLTVKLVDSAGKVVASESRQVHIEPGITPPFRLQLKVPRPHLWNGLADPYLYRAVAELSVNGTVRDTVEQRLGLRSYYVDPDKGFFLNGKPYRIRGVCRHQDVWNQGWALSNADHERDLKLIREMGANAVRCAHYQQSDYFYSLCDQAGLLVWAEIPWVNDITPGAAFAETTRGQLLDLIRQNVNHSSIFVWGLYNELRATTGDTHRLLQDLQVVAKGEDPTRPTVCAQDLNVWEGGRLVPRPTDPKIYLRRPELPKIPDLMGWNIYPGWYFGSPDDAGPILDQLRYTSRSGGICMSEYGAGANPVHHEENCQQQTNTVSQWHPEEWQSIVHEHDWAAINARPFVWGSFVWNMFDFVVAGRNEGGVPCRNDKGLVTNDRQLKKDAFYFYQANWSDTPVLHITSRRYTERTNHVTTVKIYSNAKQVELFVNGKSLGQSGTANNCVFIWNNVPLEPGENRVMAKARRGKQELFDECVWNTPQ
ncbi:MAG: glycoside hydrolase family 2 TIM barrel-domain containing protein [Verrucomicrobiota bacterium]